MAEKKKSVIRSQTADLKARGSEKEQPTKSAKVATTREERKEQKTESKPAARRESKGPSPLMTRFRNNRFGRFVLEAYYELRHKVTWPTFEEARNMTIAVIAISVVMGAILALTDFGLYRLFLLIIGGK